MRVLAPLIFSGLIFSVVNAATLDSEVTDNKSTNSRSTNDNVPDLSTTEVIASACSADPLLQDVLEGEQFANLHISYSSGLVTSSMRAAGEPEGTQKERIAIWLSLYGLVLLESPNGNHLVARGKHHARVSAGQLFDDQGKVLTHTVIHLDNSSQRSSASGCFLFSDLQTLAGRTRNLKVRGFHSYRLEPSEHSWYSVQLQKDTGPSIENVLVIGSSHQMMNQEFSPRAYLGREEIARTPHIGDDITRVFRHLPGAAAGDFSPQINVRGGEKNELAMVVDGLELHQPWYFKGLDGLVSIVDSNIIESVNLLSGGFTADYGGVTSAVADIETREPEDVRNTAGVSFLTAYGQMAGTINNNRGGWFTSLRSGYLDLAFELAGSDADVQPRYHDLFSKINYALNENNSLAANILLAEDDLVFDSGYQGEDREFTDDTSTNYNLWFNLESELHENLRVKNTAYVTEFKYRLRAYIDEPNLIWLDDREYKAQGFKSDWTATPHSEHLLKMGVDLRKLEADYDYYLAVFAGPYDNNPLHFVSTYQQAQLHPRGWDRSAYVSWRFRLLERLTTELGGRWSEQSYTELEEDTLFSPRVNLVYDFNEDTSINMSWGRFNQAQDIDALAPGDGDNNFYPSQKAVHTIVGLRHTLNDRLDLRVDVYHKDYNRLLPRYENLYENIGRFVDEATDDRIRIFPESALAKGIELGINYNTHRHFSAWANYSYSEVNDQLTDKTVARLWDQRHAANVSFNWEYGEWSYTLIGMMRSGWPTTPLLVDSHRPRNDNAARPDFENYNSERLDGYARFDARITKNRVLENGDLFQYYLEIYNILNANNPCCLEYGADFPEGGDSRARPDFDNWLPLMPSFGFRYTF